MMSATRSLDPAAAMRSGRLRSSGSLSTMNRSNRRQDGDDDGECGGGDEGDAKGDAPPDPNEQEHNGADLESRPGMLKAPLRPEREACDAAWALTPGRAVAKAAAALAGR